MVFQAAGKRLQTVILSTLREEDLGSCNIRRIEGCFVVRQ